MQKVTPQPISDSGNRLPTLRAALRLYLLVVIGTIAITVGFSQNIDISFLRLATAIFVVLGFLAGAVLILGVSPGAVVGSRPRLMYLVTGFLAGLAVWIPATWSLIFVSQTLNLLFGVLPASTVVTPQNATWESQVAIFGAILPLCQAILFFGFIFTAARGVGNWRAVWLTALLFGLYGFFSASRGISAAPGYFIVGLAAGALTLRGGGFLPGAFVISGFNLAEPILSRYVSSLASSTDSLSVQWLTAVVISGFIAFLLIQVVRLFGVSPLPSPAKPRALWWIPLLLTFVLAFGLLLGEFTTRRSTPVPRIPTPTPSGSTAPPLIAPTTGAPTRVAPSKTP